MYVVAGPKTRDSLEPAKRQAYVDVDVPRPSRRQRLDAAMRGMDLMVGMPIGAPAEAGELLIRVGHNEGLLARVRSLFGSVDDAMELAKVAPSARLEGGTLIGTEKDLETALGRLGIDLPSLSSITRSHGFSGSRKMPLRIESQGAISYKALPSSRYSSSMDIAPDLTSALSAEDERILSSAWYDRLIADKAYLAGVKGRGRAEQVAIEEIAARNWPEALIPEVQKLLYGR